MLPIADLSFDAEMRQAIACWEQVAPAVRPPVTEEQHEVAVRRLDALLDLIGGDEAHPLMSMVDVLAEGIAAYEAEHAPEPEGNGVDALRFLMTEHGLRQSELPEIGSQGVVSEVLSGKRSLTAQHIAALSKRFGVSPASFL